MKIALERLTAGLLCLVVAFLGWVLIAAYYPESARIISEQTEVIAVLLLLVAALGMVSVLALLHARRG
jgi:hypothetical protein